MYNVLRTKMYRHFVHEIHIIYKTIPFNNLPLYFSEVLFVGKIFVLH